MAKKMLAKMPKAAKPNKNQAMPPIMGGDPQPKSKPNGLMALKGMGKPKKGY
jgi:hypothetical protein